MGEHGQALDMIADNTNHLRLSYPDNSVPTSIFEARRTAESIFGKEASTLGSAEFTFDDLVVDSRAYRRTMSNAQSRIGSNALSVGHMAESDPVDIDTGQVPATKFHKASQQNDQRALNFKEKETKKTGVESLISIDLGEVVDLSPTTTRAVREQRILQHNPDILSPTRRSWEPSENVVSSPEGTSEPLLSWRLHFNLQDEDYKDYRRDRVAFQNSHWNILQKAWTLRTCLGMTDTLHNAQIILGWPTHREQSPDAVQKVFQNLAEIKALHEQFLFTPLLAMWQNGGPWTPFDPRPFFYSSSIRQAWFIKHSLIAIYGQSLMCRCNKVQAKNISTVLANLKKRRSTSNLDWSTLLKAPSKELQDIYALLSSMEAQVVHEREKSEIAETVVAFRDLISACNIRIAESAKEIECKHLEKELGIKLQSRSPEILCRQNMPVRLSSAKNRSSMGPWRYCHVILLKDRLLVARAQKLRPEARHNVVKRNKEANFLEIVEVSCCKHNHHPNQRRNLFSFQTLKFDSFEYTSAYSKLIQPIKIGLFATGEVARNTDLWPIQLVVEHKHVGSGTRTSRHRIAWQIMLGVKIEQERRDWEVPLLLCDGVFGVRT